MPSSATSRVRTWVSVESTESYRLPEPPPPSSAAALPAALSTCLLKCDSSSNARTKSCRRLRSASGPPSRSGESRAASPPSSSSPSTAAARVRVTLSAPPTTSMFVPTLAAQLRTPALDDTCAHRTRSSTPASLVSSSSLSPSAAAHPYATPRTLFHTGRSHDGSSSTSSLVRSRPKKDRRTRSSPRRTRTCVVAHCFVALLREWWTLTLYLSSFPPPAAASASGPAPAFPPPSTARPIRSSIPKTVSLRQAHHCSSSNPPPSPTTTEKRVLTEQFRTSARPSAASRARPARTASTVDRDGSRSASDQSMPVAVREALTS